jgi:hypothetical protein
MEPPCSSCAGSVSPLAPRRGINGDHRSPGGSLPSRQPNGLPYQCARGHRRSRSVIGSAPYSPNGHIGPELSPTGRPLVTERNRQRPGHRTLVRRAARRRSWPGWRSAKADRGVGMLSIGSLLMQVMVPGPGLAQRLPRIARIRGGLPPRLVLSQFRQGQVDRYRPVPLAGRRVLWLFAS